MQGIELCCCDSGISSRDIQPETLSRVIRTTYKGTQEAGAEREGDGLTARSRQEDIDPLDMLAQVRDLGHQAGVLLFQIFDFR